MSFGGISVNVDASQLQAIIQRLNAAPRVSNLALRSTILRMAGWLQTRVRRALATTLQVRQRKLNARVVRTRVAMVGDQVQGSVWVGLNPMSLIEFRARQNRTGVRSTRGTFPGAWIMVPPNAAKQHVFQRKTDARLPIEKLDVDIYSEAMRAVTDVLNNSGFEAEFFNVFERELTWRLWGRRR